MKILTTYVHLHLHNMEIIENNHYHNILNIDKFIKCTCATTLCSGLFVMRIRHNNNNYYYYFTHVFIIVLLYYIEVYTKTSSRLTKIKR